MNYEKVYGLRSIFLVELAFLFSFLVYNAAFFNIFNKNIKNTRLFEERRQTNLKNQSFINLEQAEFPFKNGKKNLNKDYFINVINLI